MDSYLEIARRVLREARQPLSAVEILRAAYQLQIVPRDLYGRTQHKTLHARLSTDILKRRARSDFYRTGPGRFFLRSLKGDRSIAGRYRTEYVAPIRAAQLGRFDVLAFPRSEIKQLASAQDRILCVDDLLSLDWGYYRMDDVRRDPRILAFRFLVILVDSGRILLSHRGAAPEGELPTRTTLGFEGVVKRDDRSLFSGDDVGLSDAALRTLAECVDLPATAIAHLQTMITSSTAMVLFEESSTPATDDLMIVVPVHCSNTPEVAETTDRIATMGWQRLPIQVNDLDHFDRWSCKIISDLPLQLTMAD